MARAMYEYTQTILQKVSFEPKLFIKELQKALKRLLPYEIEELKEWLKVYVKDRPELNHCLVYIHTQ
ncbi:hypothetical protein [Ascidiimonas aurantiaca]|uniref:hypothetical protein n=1 Tax=Ascidiimonas aurantiaca TaxID=1685432 RepID=UPI0030EBF157